MSEIDWSKAPEGAQYWRKSLERWYMADGGRAYVFSACSGKWEHSTEFNAKTIEESRDIVKRTPSPAWNGEGLPPVGTHLEWLSVYGLIGGRVVGHDGSATVVVHNDGYTGCWPHEVRPIRTPEQIAAEDRESHVLAMLCYDAFGGTRRGLAEALYDAGYRKTEG